MTLDPARRLEVLREMEAEERAEADTWSRDLPGSPYAWYAARAEALSDAIKAVESQSPPPEWVAHEAEVGGMLARAHVAERERDDAKSSAESLQERVEAQDAALRMWARWDRAGKTFAIGIRDQWLEKAREMTRSLLHPHASHCNEEHEGACQARDDGRVNDGGA